MEKVAVYWFRRDLRLEDNPALNAALESGLPVLCMFVFDKAILEGLPRDDARVRFIHETLGGLHTELESFGSGLKVMHSSVDDAWKEVLSSFSVASVHCNEDYEPYGVQRDLRVRSMLEERGVAFHAHCDHVLLRPGKIVKGDGLPYTVYTPFKNACRKHLAVNPVALPSNLVGGMFAKFDGEVPSLDSIGFAEGALRVAELKPEYIRDYDLHRNDPVLNRATLAGPHLRFGTLSIRQVAALASNETYFDQLIWRDFFIQIMYHYPRVVGGNFRQKYDGIEWRNDQNDFERWCKGETGYPMVDAGMRQLNTTGYMHNRVRMITAGFLCKHLLIDWRWGEAYFAQKLLDFELASNNGNWQWAAGTGCDAAPYFRIFNPITQLEKFDPNRIYCRRWITELDTKEYPPQMVEHKFARERALSCFKEALAD